MAIICLPVTYTPDRTRVYPVNFGYLCQKLTSSGDSTLPMQMIDLGAPSLIGQALRAHLELVAGVDVGRSRPCLKRLAHRTARAAVKPFVEFPVVVFADTICMREFEQFSAGHIPQSEAMDEAHPHAANEWPDAAVVIVAGKVEQVHRVIGAPVRVARLHGRIQIGHRKRLVHADAPHKFEGGARAIHVKHVADEGLNVAEDVAPPVESERRDFGEQVTSIAHGGLLVRKAEASG